MEKKIIRIKFLNYLLMLLLLILINKYSAQDTDEEERKTYLDCIKEQYTDEELAEGLIFVDLKIYLDTLFISDQLHEKILMNI